MAYKALKRPFIFWLLLMLFLSWYSFCLILAIVAKLHFLDSVSKCLNTGYRQNHPIRNNQLLHKRNFEKRALAPHDFAVELIHQSQTIKINLCNDVHCKFFAKYPISKLTRSLCFPADIPRRWCKLDFGSISIIH